MDALTNQKEILQNVKQMLRLTNTDNDRWLRSLIQQRWRDINSNETLIIKNGTAKVSNNKFYLPTDCKRILAFRDKGSCIPGLFVDVPFFKNCGCNTNLLKPLRRLLTINGRWANFIGVVPDDTEIEIAYEVVNEEINEEAYTSIAKYTAYQFALSYPELYTPEQRRDWRQDGVWGGARVRSAAARRKYEQDKLQIQNVMNTMVNGGAPIGLLSGVYFSFNYPTYNYL